MITLNKKKLLKFLLLFLLLLNFACASNIREFTESEESLFKHVKVINNDLNMINCTFLTPIEIYNEGESIFNKNVYVNTIKMLQFQTYKKDGNIAVIDKLIEPNEHSNEYKIQARIFNCK
ncbi:MAG: hypothetical protein U0457_00875 [Candidatus Sericytochromatia bacterium]